MLSGPLVTVIIPTYNRSALLPRAIKSVVMQSYQNWELLIVDDGSSDNTAQLVASYKDERIKYLHHVINRGAGAARNTGISSARGEYLTFLDSDDEWLPRKLEIQLGVFSNSQMLNLGIVSCQFIISEGELEITSSKRVFKGDVFNDVLARKARLNETPTLMVRRRVVQPDVMFDEALSNYQDMDYVLRIVRHSQMDVVDEPLVRVHVGNWKRISDDQLQRAKALEYLIDKYYEALNKKKRLLGWYYLELHDRFARAGDRRAAGRALIRSIFTDPIRWRAYAFGLGWLLGPKWGKRVMGKLKLKLERFA